MIYELFLYSGIFNIVLGTVYMFSQTNPTPEGILMGGAMNILLVLAYVAITKLNDACRDK